MSEKVKKALKENIVQPELKKVKKESNGKVLKVYDKPKDNEDIENRYNRNYADVEVLETETGRKVTMTKVPIVHGSVTSNIDGRHIQKGDDVVINYVGGNPAYPQIIGRNYGVPQKRHDEMMNDKGVFVADAYGYFG